MQLETVRAEKSDDIRPFLTVSNRFGPRHDDILRPWAESPRNASPPHGPFDLDSTIDLHLLACLNVGSTGIGLFDPMERLRHANPAFAEAYAARVDDQPSWEALMRGCHANRRGLLIETDDIEAWLASERRSHRQMPSRAFESRRVDGQRLWITESLQSDGWLLVVVSDVTALSAPAPADGDEAHASPDAGQIDVLTGLPNRRNILHRLDTLLATSRQLRMPLSLAVLEIDDFGTAVGQHGREDGDRLLEHFAGQVRRHLRPLDELGRIGDCGFLLLMPNTTITGADEALARLRGALRGAVPLPTRPGFRYDFSAGVAPVLAADGPSDAFTRADGALYLAKTRGRGCQALVDPGEVGALRATSGATA